jgi:hypothetical protein
MKRIHLLSTTALAVALLAVPAAAQRQGANGDGAPAAQTRATAAVDRVHKGDGTDGGPAELLRMAQSAMRGGQTAQANELLERAETRLLTGVEPTKPGQGEPAFHASEARRALMGRDRAEAMRHTNMAIATLRDAGGGGGGGAATGSDAGGGDRWSVVGGGPGAVDAGMGTLPGARGRAVVRDAGMGGTSISRAEGGVLLAQTGTGSGRGAPTGLPPGDTVPGWSGLRGGTGGNTAPQGSTPGPAPLGSPPSTVTPPFPSQSLPPSGASSSSLSGGEPARVGGAPPGDTSRSPGSSGLSGAGVGGPLR